MSRGLGDVYKRQAPEINATAASGDITINGVSLVNHTHMSGAVGKPDK